MRTIKIIKLIVILIAFCLSVFQSFSQQSESRDIIFKAMRDEMNRNLNNLALENLKKPFFICYNIHDFKVMSIKAALGAITSVEEKPVRKLDTRVIVGDYKRTQENFFNPSYSDQYGFSRSNDLPLENDYDGIRRVLWKSTDNDYKSAAESFEGKISAINQQKLTEDELSLEDFCKSPVVKLFVQQITYPFERTKWENAAKELSMIFEKYPGIFKSEVSITFLQGDEFILNSEGTETVFPVSIAAIQVNASTQALDGEPLNDQVLYYELTPSDLPGLDAMKNKVTEMAEDLVKMKTAQVLADSYTGPVLFEGQAVAELIAQRLFSGDESLIAQRKQIYSDPQMLMFMNQMQGKSLEDKIGKKLISDDISITAFPGKSDFNGKKLIGSFQVDMEGVVPSDELVIIEKGTLKTLLNGRTPSPKVESSNGHKRMSFQSSSFGSAIGPGVIEVNSTKVEPSSDLKKKLIETAKEQGLDYAIIVRKLKSPSSGIQSRMDESSIMSFSMGSAKKGAVSKPIAIYKVSVADGKEELLRTAELGGISLNTLKKIKGISDEKFAYNTLLTQSSGISGIYSLVFSILGGEDVLNLNGIPSSFIVPGSLLVEELDVQKEKRMITGKLPVVENPIKK